MAPALWGSEDVSRGGVTLAFRVMVSEQIGAPPFHRIRR